MQKGGPTAIDNLQNYYKRKKKKKKKNQNTIHCMADLVFPTADVTWLSPEQLIIAVNHWLRHPDQTSLESTLPSSSRAMPDVSTTPSLNSFFNY